MKIYQNLTIIGTSHIAKESIKEVKEVIFLGDILVNYGDMLNRGHTLVPVGYNEDWWILELEKALGENKLGYEKYILDTELKNLALTDKQKEVLKTINDQQYSHHVNSQKNEFAKWVKEILRDADCSRELLRCQNRYAALKVVEKYLRAYKI